jgi:hypothetical protein
LNVVVAECMRGAVFNKVGDIINMNIRYNGGGTHSSVLTNIATSDSESQSFLKVKARVVATSRKFPGFFKFSGYKQVNLLCPDLVMTKKQLRKLIDTLYSHLPQHQEVFERKVKKKYPPSTEDLPKSKLYMKVAPSVTRQQRNHFKNDLLNYINDDQVYLFDSFSFSEDIESRMVIL